ncbi:MAG: hypothetical protein CMB99_04560 [Flavobacteriaceae bacterium]|nr:hypothetical protein [Flavobacteriaceae bacterium]|tara:strand:+ start:24143 stop:25255 length:1113 start_codon:yes stop_codon:yes gene_type:complete
MNYKETLFFIGKCLTINHEAHNKSIIEQKLKVGDVDWENVVKVSTAHYVFPALYVNLKRANFLSYLPEELVNYMDHITQLNRERNQQIIKQAKEINVLLRSNGITPIFLKGSGNLLEGLYEDSAERMVGDIDFIVKPKNYEQSVELLFKNGYEKVHDTKYDFPQFKHFPRLKNPNETAAVEVHKELLLEEYASEFHYNFAKDKIQRIGNINVIGFEDQFCLSIIAKQINDKGQYYNDIALRNAYDVFLLSKEVNTNKALSRFEKLFHPLNIFVCISNEVFNDIQSLEFYRTKKSEEYLKKFMTHISDDRLRRKHHQKTKKKMIRKTRLNVLKKALVSKPHRTWFFKRIADEEWQEARMIEFGLKKPKPNT